MTRIAAALTVISGVALSWGTVCLGEDGHVAVEISVAGRCLDDIQKAPAEHGAHLSSCLRDAGCGPCMDISGASDAWLVPGSPDLPEPRLAIGSRRFAPLAFEAGFLPVLQLREVAPPASHTATLILRC
jgi:hypothetical protein